MKCNDLKKLTCDLDGLKKKLQNIEAEIQRLSANKIQVENGIDTLNSKISSLTRKNPVVSEHAILRYMERGMAIDVDGITKSILTPSIIAKIKEFGDGKYVKNGLTLVVKNNVVITVV